MRRFFCSHCSNEVYFENVRCERCGDALGFEPSARRMVALAHLPDGAFKVEGRFSRRSVRYCGNQMHGVCNWLVPNGEPNPLCRACRLNRTIPNLASAENIAAWAAIEGAKKRLVYSLLRLGLPLDANGGGGTTAPLTFDFLVEATTGHFNGVITIDVAEADAVERERQRQSLDESYRSLLGHFRHESGHYYWMRLVDGTRWLEPFRQKFGDERADYAAALARHHAQGAPSGWAASHVTAYASAHPAEDWAETWAHYLHIVDVLDTAVALGIQHPAGRLLRGPGTWFGAFDAYRAQSMQRLVDEWIPFALAMNGLNRSMGHVRPTVRRAIASMERDSAEARLAAEQAVVLWSRRNLLRHAGIERRVRQGKTSVYAGHYDIASGRVSFWDEAAARFAPAEVAVPSGIDQIAPAC